MPLKAQKKLLIKTQALQWLSNRAKPRYCFCCFGGLVHFVSKPSTKL